MAEQGGERYLLPRLRIQDVRGRHGPGGGVITEESTFTCTGSMPVEGVTGGISCWKHAGHGLENFHDGLCNSCNPFFIHVGELLGAQTFAKYREAFGFTEQTGIDLPGESWSLYHSVEDLGPAGLATESFGQNFSITPVQMITACAAVANGGYLMTPHVVDRVVDSGEYRPEGRYQLPQAGGIRRNLENHQQDSL